MWDGGSMKESLREIQDDGGVTASPEQSPNVIYHSIDDKNNLSEI